MKARELERLLALADEVAEREAPAAPGHALEAEIGHEREIAALAPEVARSAAYRLP